MQLRCDVPHWLCLFIRAFPLPSLHVRRVGAELQCYLCAFKDSMGQCESVSRRWGQAAEAYEGKSGRKSEEVHLSQGPDLSLYCML